MARGTVERFAPLLALLLVAAAQPAPRGGRGANPPRRPPPDPALLEFLGSFETAGGRWIDPMSLVPPADSDGPGRSGSERTHDTTGGSKR